MCSRCAALAELKSLFGPGDDGGAQLFPVRLVDQRAEHGRDVAAAGRHSDRGQQLLDPEVGDGHDAGGAGVGGQGEHAHGIGERVAQA